MAVSCSILAQLTRNLRILQSSVCSFRIYGSCIVKAHNTRTHTQALTVWNPAMTTVTSCEHTLLRFSVTWFVIQVGGHWPTDNRGPEDCRWITYLINFLSYYWNTKDFVYSSETPFIPPLQSPILGIVQEYYCKHNNLHLVEPH